MSIRTPRQKVEALFKILKRKKQCKYEGTDEEYRCWKGKTEASRKLGISRPSIDKILMQYPKGMPQKPKKMIPKYYEDFDETEIAKRIKKFYWDVTQNDMTTRGKEVYSCARGAFHILKGKDLIYFDENDYALFWGTPQAPPHPDFVDPQTGKLHYAKASMLRMCMRLSGTRSSTGANLVDDPRFDTRGLKREKGRRKKWYLDEGMILRVVGVIKEVDTLIMFLLGILFGGRFSALRRIKVADIDFNMEIIDVYEPKVKKPVEKPLPTHMVLDLLRFYIDDFNIKHKLFKWSYVVYNDRLKQAGEDADLKFSISTHIMKHTTITQMSLHGVDVDVIEEYVGTDAKTIKDFYRGGGEKKIRAQIRGDKLLTTEKWFEWVERLVPFFLERYNYIKPFNVAKDGISLKK